MKLHPFKLGIAAGIASALFYSLGALAIYFAAKQALEYGAPLMYMTSLGLLEPYIQITGFGFVSGLIQYFAYSFVYGFVLAIIYNFGTSDK